MFAIFANVEDNPTAFGRVAFRKVYSVGNADVTEVLVVVHYGKTRVIIPLSMCQYPSNNPMEKELTEK